MQPLAQTLAAALNHLLAQADWARARLADHGGKRARVELPLYAVALDVTADGRFEAAVAEGLPDVSIRVPPLALARWMVDREQAWREADVSGDTEFAAALSFVAANLHWEFEEDLSQVLGDVAAHRVGQGLRAAAQWPASAAQAGARNIAEYLVEEKHLLATRLQADDFAQSVDELRDAVERLDKRLARLESAPACRPRR